MIRFATVTTFANGDRLKVYASTGDYGRPGWRGYFVERERDALKQLEGVNGVYDVPVYERGQTYSCKPSAAWLWFKAKHAC